MVKGQYIDASDLSENSIKKYENTLKRLDNADLTVNKALKLSNDELREKLNSKATDKSIEAMKRVLRQMNATKKREKIIVSRALDDYELKGNEKKKKKIELTRKISRNSYFEIVERLKETYRFDNDNEAYIYAKELLLNKNSVQLTDKEREILAEYSP